jgi:hypothetical protein
MAEIEIQIGREGEHVHQESGLSPKPFYVGELLSGIHPHDGPTGNPHNGNFKVVEIRDKSGYKAVASCSQGCGLQVVVYAFAKPE